MTETAKINFRAKRAATYRAAIAKRQETQPDLSAADWFREACDLLASRDLAPGSGEKDDTVPAK
jgi:hypothetical protein